MSFLHAREDVPFVQTDDQGRIVSVTSYKDGFDVSAYFNALGTGTVSVAPSEIATHADDTIPGSLSGSERTTSSATTS
jgi:hypothetical protein